MTASDDRRWSSQGIITGFTDIRVGDPDSPEATTPSTFSNAQMLGQLQAIMNVFGPERWEELQESMLRHIQRTDNPHKLSLHDITLDVGATLFPHIFSGTTPPNAPVASLWAPLAHLNRLAITRSTSIRTIDTSGYAVTAAPNTIALDCTVDGIPRVGFWAARTNTVTQAPVALGGVMGSYADARWLNWDKTAQLTLLRSGGSGPHGITFTGQSVADQNNIVDVMMLPISPAAGYRLSAAGHWVWWNAAGEVQASDGAHAIVRRLPSGWWRVVLRYQASSADIITGTLVIASSPENTVNVDANVALFAVGPVQHYSGKHPGPILTLGESIGATVGQWVVGPRWSKNGVVVWKGMVPNGVGAFITGTQFSLSQTTDAIQCMSGSASLAAATTADDEEVVAINIGLQTIGLGTSTVTSTTISGQEVADLPTQYTLHATDMLLTSLTVYAQPDDGQQLNFHTGATP